MRIRVERLQQIYRKFALSYGAGDIDAQVFADCLLRADLRGHNTQGIGLAPYLEELFASGVTRFGQDFEVVKESPATALVDGHAGVGQIISTRAMSMAIQKAKALGIGLVTVRNSGDCGMASNYAIQAMEQGLIGISMSTGPSLVAPWGGRDARFCTNPLALAVPAGRKDPIVLDMATSACSMGAVVLAARDGVLLAGKSVVDREGVYTDDPSRVILNNMHRESRMSGALLPAGPKGFGMVLLVELLAGLLSGERSWENETVATSEARPAHYSQTFIAISIEHFHEPSAFLSAAERMVETLLGSRPAEGFAKVRLPGTGAVDKEDDYRKNGVIVREEEWEMLLAMASRLGFEVPAD
ncbi:Ldh family oxidoreductase [Pseudomonas sp. LS-2]|uniref:Ldh family oxidoreductase n=1 Tax=Pseudomonas sp. LS-2 TaxID=2315859 RepID=UPI0010585726|nr:Ldh family oxidoreductase [Pseudomonas sp. LS-2]